MLTGTKISFLVLAAGELVLGMLGNGLIGLINCTEWIRSRKVSSADFILTSLAMARIFQLSITLFDAFIAALNPHLYATGTLANLVSILWALTHHLTTWLAACLSIFYLLKIANFNHFFFLWLKARMNRVVLVSFLGSLFSVSVNSLMHDSLCELWINTFKLHERNMTVHFGVSEDFYFKSLTLFSLTFVIPFLLSLTSLLLLLLSLVRHTKNMQLNSMGSGDSSTEAHKRAMKVVTTFLILFIIYFFPTVIGSWIFHKVQSYEVMMCFVVISTAFPSGHSFIIILGNRKLRQSSLRLLCHLKFSLRKAKL
ncbi:PREDICTED: taste receptor type 2 member 42-like [Galeopterus variegatus]|uniref:Taste receptor type 2 n=1 Tax=Galeopterus variegatus TaxID=482537 RepID=A0ABM0RSY4_GALVR|nr:PREDICTED: taste receptor type 2 member 42-like [Galeopterus variegatus]